MFIQMYSFFFLPQNINENNNDLAELSMYFVWLGNVTLKTKPNLATYIVISMKFFFHNCCVFCNKIYRRHFIDLYVAFLLLNF